MSAPSQTGRPHVAVGPSPEKLTVDDLNSDANHAAVNSAPASAALEEFQIHGGPKFDFGNVRRLKQSSFEDLVATLPVQQIPITRSEFHRLPKADRDQLKRVDYIVAATYKLSPSPRPMVNALTCWVLILDVDDNDEGQRMLATSFNVLLGDLAAVVWHTANSTPDEPRLRIMVRADGIPVSQYAAAVEALGDKLGMSSVNKESKIPVQPMFLPVQFKGESPPEFVYSKPDGRTFDVGDVATPTSNPAPVADPDIADLDYLRPPMEDVTMEIAEDVLTKIDPNCGHQQWVEMGMSLKHQFGPEGLDLWDKWSEGSDDKYPGREKIAAKWKTFRVNTKDRVPVTFRSVIKMAKESGWDDEPLKQRGTKTLKRWIWDDDRTADELRSEGISRIAELGLPSQLARDEILHDLADVLRKKSGTKPSIVALRKQLQEEIRSQRKAAPSPLPPWAKDFVYVGGHYNEFYSLKDSYKCPPVTFDHEHKRDMERDDIEPHDYVLNECMIRQVQDYAYHPGRDPFFTDERGFRCVNTYRDSYAKPDATHLKEAKRLLKRHLSGLIKEPEYRRTVMDIIAYLVQRPGEKIMWALLIQGVEGCGNGTLADIAAAVLGNTNVRRLEAGAALESQFNDFAAGSQLVVFDEVRNVGENKFKVMEKVKPLITDPFVELNRKYERQRNVKNVANYILTTNHHDALPISDDDRRFFVLKSALQTKADLVANQVTPRCKELHAFIEAHPGAFRAIFEAHIISKGFDPKGRAPETPYRQELSRSGESPLKAEIRDLLDAQRSPYISRDLLSIGTLAAELNHNPQFGRTPTQTVANVLSEMGYVRVGEARVDGPSHRLWAQRGSKFWGDIVAAAEELKNRVLIEKYIGPDWTS